MSDELTEFKNALIQMIKDSNNIFIVGHNNADIDSLASSYGIYTLAKALGKEAYIIIDNNWRKNDNNIKKIIYTGIDNKSIIYKEKFNELYTQDDVLIITDTNKPSLLLFDESELKNISKKAIIDHHEMEDTTVKATIQYINPNVSSASEIISGILIAENIKISPITATYLLSGITLDTDRFQRNTSKRTHSISSRLIEKGADRDQALNILAEDIIVFIKVQSLNIKGTNYIEYNNDSQTKLTITYNREKNTKKYERFELGLAADTLLKYANIVFVMGFNEDKNVMISLRCKNTNDEENGLNLNAADIIKKLYITDGGGRPNAAGGIIKLGEHYNSLAEIEEHIMNIVDEIINMKSKTKRLLKEIEIN